MARSERLIEWTVAIEPDLDDWLTGEIMAKFAEQGVNLSKRETARSVLRWAKKLYEAGNPIRIEVGAADGDAATIEAKIEGTSTTGGRGASTAFEEHGRDSTDGPVVHKGTAAA